MDLFLALFTEPLIPGNDNAQIVIGISIMLFGSFLLTRLTKLAKLPNVTAYILLGIIVGPFVLNIFGKNMIEGMSFIKDIALSFVAFSIGQFFEFSEIKKNGSKILLISVIMSAIKGVVLFAVMRYLVKMSFESSLIIASISLAASPTSTLVTIRQTKSSGNFVVVLLETIAIQNIICIFVFGLAESIVNAKVGGSFEASEIILPIVYNIASCIVGFGLGFLLKALMPKRRTKDNRLIILIAFLLAFCGICLALNISPLLGCMAIGSVYKNTTDDEKLFKQINYFSPPILVIFFVVSGMNLQVDKLINTSTTGLALPILVVGILTFAFSDITTYFGTRLGCKVAKMDDNTKKFLGLALFPQSTVAIGLASIASEMNLPADGVLITTIIITSCIINEIIGPILTKISLRLSGSYSTEQIVAMDKSLEQAEQLHHERNEIAFTEGADESEVHAA